VQSADTSRYSIPYCGLLASVRSQPSPSYATPRRSDAENHYKFNPRGQLRHPVFRDLSIGPLIEVLNTTGGTR